MGKPPIGRITPRLTEGIRLTVYQWTGSAQSSCPWAAFRDPFVARVLDAYPWFEPGMVGTYAPNASHRLIEGIGYYHRAISVCRAKVMELEREEQKKRGNH